MNFILTTIIISFSFTACDVLQSAGSIKTSALTSGEIVSGPKEALKVGTGNVVNTLCKENGFYQNPLLKIPFPEDAKIVENKLRDIGLNKLVDDFILSMNRGAENAVKSASPIFIDAIKEMSFADAKNILNGSDNAATEYFKDKTSRKLFGLFKPKV